MPKHAQNQVIIDCEVAARHITVIELRAPWRKNIDPDWTSFPIARLHYTRASHAWTLYWRDRNLRFHRYDRISSSVTVEELLREIDHDPTGISWG